MVRKRSRGSNAPNNSVFLPMELIIEILSLLSVKDIVRFKCVSKSWNTLTSDSNFVDIHLRESSRNPHLTLSWYPRPKFTKNMAPFPVHRLLKKPSANISSDDDFLRMENPSVFVGSCNGLLCFLSRRPGEGSFKYIHFSNPATRTRCEPIDFTFGDDFNLTFGYDASSRTYKIVAFLADQRNSKVKVFNLGDNCWRNIQNFPAVPYNRYDNIYCMSPRLFNNGAHFCGTINWLALDKSITHINQFVIVSLDLSTETYKQFMLPLGLDEVPIYQPRLSVLSDSLCFSHEFNKTEFILWKMKEYGVQESWIQLFKISYQNLAMQMVKLPMHNIDYGLHRQLRCLYVNGDVVIFASKCCRDSFIYDSFIYNSKDKTVVKIESEYYIHWFSDSKDYVESLVSIY